MWDKDKDQGQGQDKGEREEYTLVVTVVQGTALVRNTC